MKGSTLNVILHSSSSLLNCEQSHTFLKSITEAVLEVVAMMILNFNRTKITVSFGPLAVLQLYVIIQLQACLTVANAIQYCNQRYIHSNPTG